MIIDWQKLADDLDREWNERFAKANDVPVEEWRAHMLGLKEWALHVSVAAAKTPEK